jgi:hypothetical protein
MRAFKLALVGLFAVLVGLWVPTVAAAAVDDITPVGPDAQAVDTALFNLSPFIVSFILGALVPLVTGILTKLNTPSKVKAWVAVALDAVVGLVTVSMVDGGGAVISQSAVVAAVLAYFASQTSYTGFWRPHAITSSAVTITNDAGQHVEVPGKLANVGVK